MQSFGRRIERAEKPLHASAQILRAYQERLGFFGVSLDQTDGGARWERGEEIFVARPRKFLAAMESQHLDRILLTAKATLPDHPVDDV